jgi:hypothetical protein
MSDMGNSTDRERLFHVIMDQTFGKPIIYDSAAYTVGAYIDGYSPLQIGDLVVGNTRNAIGYLQSIRLGNSRFENDYFIKLLGTEFVQSWTNESFKVIKNIPEYLLYTGDKRKFALLAYDAILRGDEHDYRFSDIKVNDDGTAMVSTRKRWCSTIHAMTVPDWNQYLRFKTGATLCKFLKEQGMMDDSKYEEVKSE